MRSSIRLALLVILLLAGRSVAHAVPILDQSFLPGLSSSAEVTGGQQFAQTFLVTFSGLMTGVDLSIVPSTPLETGDLLISILLTTSGLPQTNNALALDDVRVPASYWAALSTFEPDSYRHIEFMPFAVTAGDLLAISVRQAVATSELFYWRGGGDGRDQTGRVRYVPGDPYVRSGPLQSWTEMGGFDFAFQTYVDPTPAPEPVPVGVPEPSSLLLMGTGLAFAAFWKRSR